MRRNKGNKNDKKQNHKILIVIGTAIICVILLILGLAKGWYKDPITSQPNDNTQEKIIATNTNATRDKTDAGQYISAAMGDSDEFYKPAEGTKTVLDYGQGSYDITPDIVKWSFSQPIVNLPQLGEKMGLKFQTTKPVGYKAKVHYEVYSPDDDPDIELRQKVFLVADNGDYVCYTIGSRIVEDSKGNVIYMTYPVTLEGETLCIAASSMPYYDGTNLVIGNPVDTKYGDSKVSLTMHKLNEKEAEEELIKAEESESAELETAEIYEEGDELNNEAENMEQTDETIAETEQ